MKKIKLLLSFIALCFSLSVLCFGIYAANQVDFSISGNIGYQVTDAYVNITTHLYRSSYYPKTKSKLGALAKSFISNTQNVEFGYLNAYSEFNQDKDYNLNTLQTSLENNSMYNPSSSDNIVFDFSGLYKSYFVVINIQNLSSDKNVCVQVLDNNLTSYKVSNNNVVSYASNGFAKVSSGETNRTIVFGYTIDDLTQSVSQVDFCCGIKVEAKDYSTIVSEQTSKLGQSIVCASSSSIPTIKMGTYEQNDVLWRLASIDGGATKYIPEFDEDDNFIIPIGECVFVQESATVDLKFELEDGYSIVNGKCYRNETNNTIYANDYFLSNLDSYLSNDYVTLLGISQNSIYTNITPRSKVDLQKDMGVKFIYDENDDCTFYFETYNHASSTNINNLTFWSLSMQEICSLLCGNYDNYFDDEIMEDALNWGVPINYIWWTRSPYIEDTEVVYCVWQGDASQADCVSCEYSVRPAFLFNL